MNDAEMGARLESLEIRYSHQESALEELTRTLLAQEQLIKHQQEKIEHLERLLKSMESGAAAMPQDEKPPHY